MEIVVTPSGLGGAMLDCGQGPRRAATGFAGIGTKRTEGDGITPVGTFAIRRALYRPDRMRRPRTALPLAAIEHDDGWCDAPDDPAYNRPVKLPYHASAEALWRKDHLYDLVVVLGFNDAPVVPGAGSAIFLHVAQTDFSPTQGCIGLAASDLVELLALLGHGDTILIKA
jgi:L,D-peptidoglycan transpeptidase YkuD (ErfK/YbiS/YcfS/YnhG family)